MAFFDSQSSYFAFDQTVGGALVSMGAFISEISGLPGPRNLNDVTALGDAGAKFIPGLENVTITISGHFDDSAAGSGGPDVIFGIHRTGTATGTFEYGPKGNTSGFVRYTGEAWVSNFEETSRVGSQVTYTVTLQVDGTVTRNTFA